MVVITHKSETITEELKADTTYKLIWPPLKSGGFRTYGQLSLKKTEIVCHKVLRVEFLWKAFFQNKFLGVKFCKSNLMEVTGYKRSLFEYRTTSCILNLTSMLFTTLSPPIPRKLCLIYFVYRVARNYESPQQLTNIHFIKLYEWLQSYQIFSNSLWIPWPQLRTFEILYIEAHVPKQRTPTELGIFIKKSFAS